MKKKLSALLILTAISYVFITQDAVSQQDYKKLARVYKIDSTREIIITAPNAAQMMNMGDKVFIIVDKKPVIMNIIFPMMTVARCRLAPGYEGYIGRLYKGMQVYKYEQGIGNRELTDNDSRKEAEGNSTLQITVSHNSKIYYLNQEDWEKILKTFMESFGKKMPESNVVKEETRKAIMNPTFGGLQISLSDIAYAIGNANINSPGSIDKLTDGDYYVWVVGNNIISQQVVSLRKNQTEKVYFDLNNKSILVESNPQGAQIYIDDVPQNLTTPSKVMIPNNKNSFKLGIKQDGYYDSSQFISVQENIAPKYSFNLVPASNAFINVTSSPDGAYVYANDRYMGISPLKIKVNSNTNIEVSVRKDGFLARSQYVSVGNNETKRLDFSLPAAAKDSKSNSSSDDDITKKYTIISLNYTMGYFDVTAGFGVPPKYFENMFTYGNNNFYGGEINFLFGKWFGYYVNISFAGVPAKTKSDYSVNQLVLDFAFGIGFLPKIWKFYLFIGFGFSTNLPFNPFCVGLGLEYKAQLGFMFTKNIGINIGFRRNYAIYYAGYFSANTINYGAYSYTEGSMFGGGTYISIGVSL